MNPAVRRDYSALIENLLSPYSVWRAGASKFRSACPIHKGDNVTSFSIYTNGRFHCFRCNASGDIVRLVMAVNHLTLKQATDYVGTAPTVKGNINEIPQIPPTLEQARTIVPYPVIRDSVLGPYRSNCPRYLVDRGFSERALKTYEVGYDLQKARIVIPVRDWERRLVGLTYRVDFDDDKQQPAKYWHDNFLKNLHLYGFHLHADKPLKRFFLVEGQLDVIRMWQLGFAAGAVMGDNISDDQVDLLRRHCRASQVVLAYDNDEAGAECTSRTIQKLAKTRFGPGLGILSYSKKDPGDLRETDSLRIDAAYSRPRLPDRLQRRPISGVQEKRGNHA